MYTLGQMLENRTILSPEHYAVISGKRRITYQMYNQKINQLAHYLLDLGIKKGDRIGILCETDLEFPMLFYAIAKIGAISVLLNWRLNPDELSKIIDDSNPKVIFYHTIFHTLTVSFQHLQIQQIALHQDDDSLDSMIASFPDTNPEVKIELNDPATLTYTSGTTGRPKGVIATHQNLYAVATSTFFAVPAFSGEKLLYPLPLFHISGVTTIINSVVAGYTLVLFSEFHPDHIWDLIEQEKINILMSVPAMLTLMLPTLLKKEREISSLRLIGVGSSSLPKSLLSKYIDLGFYVVQFYGLTEFTGATSVWTPPMGIENSKSVGKTIFCQLKIVDPVTKLEVTNGQVGEILLKGPQLFAGYWNDPEETNEVVRDGWFHTGDAGYVDDHNFLYIVDRYKDIINCNTEKIFPTEVESILLEMEDILDVALIGVPDPIWEELPRAYVVKNPDSNLLETDILDYCHQRLAKFKLHEVTFVEKLPKNSAGKILKYQLREQAEQEKDTV